MSVHEYRPAHPQKRPRPAFPVPWGLFVVLAIYALAVVGYVWKTYWQSPDYQAAEHSARALLLLGVDDGRSCSRSALEEAFGHLLEAARLMPENKELAKHTERLRWRFDERGFPLAPDFKRKAELVSEAARRVEEERSPWLAVGSRDRGWAPDQLLAAPSRVAWWSLPGAVLILAVWAFGQFSARKVREREHEANLKQAEAEVKALGAWRTGLGVAPSGPPAAVEDEPTNPTAPIAPDEGEAEDERTNPSAPIAPEPLARPSSGRHPAVEKPKGRSGAVAKPGRTTGRRPAVEPATPASSTPPESGRSGVVSKTVRSVARPGVPSGSRKAVAPDEGDQD